MSPFVAEFVGTFLLIVFGNGVVANVILSKTKGNNSGWIVICLGWAIAVFVGVYAAQKYSGAHLNPAVTIALAVQSGNWTNVLPFISAQFLGSMLGACTVWLIYKPHYEHTTDSDIILATFCTSPAIYSPFYNFLTEFLGTFTFILAILFLGNSGESVNLGALSALPVALLVLGIGLSLGGPTGYSINPARDLGPRIIHFLLPISNKKDSQWKYSWIPVVAPILGGIVAVWVKNVLIL